MSFDIFCIILFAILIIRAFRKGAIYMIFKICNFLLAIFFIPYISKIVGEVLKTESKILIYIISFIVLYTIINLVVYFIEKFINAVHLGGVNKIVGGILGLVQALCITYMILIVMLFLQSNESIKSILETSKVVHYISLQGQGFNKYFPETIKTKLDDFNFKNKEIKTREDIYYELKKGVKTNED